ncbi:MAG: methyl-accepting chemotaxis protein [Bacillota bacterium]
MANFTLKNNIIKVRFGLQFKITLSIIISFLVITTGRSVFLQYAVNWTDNILMTNIASGIVSIFLASIIAFFVVRQFIRKPLDNLTALGNKLGENNLTQKAEIRTKDEFGQLAGVFNHTIDNFRLLIEQLQAASENISSNSDQLAASSKQIDTASGEIVCTVQELANGANEQSQQISEIAQAIDNMVQNIQNINSKLRILAASAGQVIEAAEGGAFTVNENINTMKDIADFSQTVGNSIKLLDNDAQEIAQILDLINGIAEQTNLLALNAAIEAARAGEAGRGFSVVAEEIRKLAEQSRGSTNSIRLLINKTQGNTNEVVKLMANSEKEVNKGIEASQKTKEAFENIIKGNRESTRQVKEINILSEEIASSSQQIGATIQEISAVVEEFAAGTEEVASSTEQQGEGIKQIISAIQELAIVSKDLTALTQQFKTS